MYINPTSRVPFPSADRIEITHNYCYVYYTLIPIRMANTTLTVTCNYVYIVVEVSVVISFPTSNW